MDTIKESSDMLKISKADKIVSTVDREIAEGEV
jgi:hypothetical protein